MLLDGWREGHLACKNWVVRYWRGYLSGARCKWLVYGPADATATPSSLAPVKSRMVYLSDSGSHRLCWKRPLNGCSSTSTVVCRSVSQSVCHNSEPCKNCSTNQDAVWVEDSGRPKEPCTVLDIGPHPLWEGAILRGEGRTIVKYRDTVVICAKTAEPIEILFRIWTLVGPRKHIRWGSRSMCKGAIFRRKDMAVLP